MKWPFVIGLSAFTAILGMWSQCQIDTPRDVIFRSLQPKNIDYHSYDPYQVIVRVAQSGKLRVFVTKQGDSGYGHSVDINICCGEIQVESANWKPDGLIIAFSSGHRLFVPKAAFIGGR